MGVGWRWEQPCCSAQPCCPMLAQLAQFCLGFSSRPLPAPSVPTAHGTAPARVPAHTLPPGGFCCRTVLSALSTPPHQQRSDGSTVRKEGWKVTGRISSTRLRPPIPAGDLWKVTAVGLGNVHRSVALLPRWDVDHRDRGQGVLLCAPKKQGFASSEPGLAGRRAAARLWLAPPVGAHARDGQGGWVPARGCHCGFPECSPPSPGGKVPTGGAGPRRTAWSRAGQGEK